MPIVLDNTQGSTLGMAMSQHAIDKMVGQRMQMTDIYAKTTQMQGQLLHERGMAKMQLLQNMSGGYDPDNESQKAIYESMNQDLDAGNAKFNIVRDMTAAHSEDIQDSDYNSFKNRYSRDAYYQNLEDNSYEPSRKGGMLASIGNKVAGAIGSAAGAIGDAASSAYNSIVGTDEPASPSPATTASPSAPMGPDPAPTTSSNTDIKTALDNIKAKYNLPFENQPAKPLTTPQNDFTQIYKSTAFNPSPMRK